MTTTSCILAIDTATGPCSVAVWHEGAIAAYVETLRPSVQSACLMPMVEKALSQAGVSYSNLSAVACTTGPGSFTGIRVGLAAAQGICIASGIPSLGFSTLEVLAFAAHADSAYPVLSVLNAGKSEFYYQLFAAPPLWEPLSPAALGNADAVEGTAHRYPSLALCGNLAMDALPHCGITFPRADALALLAAAHPEQAVPLVPLYIRPPDAKLPVKNI